MAKATHLNGAVQGPHTVASAPLPWGEGGLGGEGGRGLVMGHKARRGL